MTRVSWTPERQQKLIDAYTKPGATRKNIAAEVGLSEGAVDRAITRLGLVDLLSPEERSARRANGIGSSNRPLGLIGEFKRLMDKGVNTADAARILNISIDYACSLRAQHNHERSGNGTDLSVPKFAYHDQHVADIIAHGGYSRLSEKLTRTGHVACLPLIPFSTNRPQETVNYTRSVASQHQRTIA